MKTKLLTFVFAIVAINIDSFAASKIGNLYYELNSTNLTATVVSQNEQEPYWTTQITTANIPATLTVGSRIYTVIRIGRHAFQGCTSLESVTIPNTITNIRDKAFYSCTGLTAVNIPNSVTDLEYDAFRDCSSLVSVTIGSGVKSIGSTVFSGCTSLTSVTINSNGLLSKTYSTTNNINSVLGSQLQITEYIIGDSVTSIGRYAFYGSSSLINVTIGKNTDIGDYAFGNCDSLTSVTIHDGVTTIGNYAFSGCTGLTSIEIPNSVTSIGNSAFSGCSSLSSIVIPSSVTSIGNGAFYQSVVNEVHYDGTLQEWCCKSWTPDKISSNYTLYIGNNLLEDIEIPNNVTSIGGCVFWGCSSLTSVEIPNSVTSIDERAFDYCYNLISVTLNSNSLVSANRNTGVSFSKIFGSQVLEYIIGDSVMSIGNDAFYCNKTMTSVIISNSVTNIGENAFRDCENLTSVKIGTGVSRIKGAAFYGCNNLTSVNISDIAKWCTIDFENNPLSYAKHLFLDDIEITNLVIPESVNTISSGAFRNCIGLVSVTIPNSVTSIRSGAFYGCTGLTTITVPGSVNTIESSAFAECSRMESVYIQNGVKTLGAYAFYIQSLTCLYIPNSITTMEETAFYGSIKELHFDGSLEEWFSSWGTNFFIPAYPDGYDLYINDEKIEDLVIPDNIRTIRPLTFNSCKSLKSITIPEGHPYIYMEESNGPSYTFAECKNLRSVSLGSSFGNISHSAFRDCKNLRSVEIPTTSSYKIGANAFSNCNRLESITLGSGVTEIGGGAFSGCTGLTSIEIPNRVTSIGSDAFYGCSGLTSVTIPNSVTRIGDYAFYGCSGLTTVTIGKGIKKIEGCAFRDCNNLTSVTSLSKTPPEMGKTGYLDGNVGWVYYYVFDGVPCSRIPLYVPDESVESYKTAEQWRSFSPILPLSQKPGEDQAIDEVLNDNKTYTTHKILSNGQIYILRGEKVYTLQGQEVR